MNIDSTYAKSDPTKLTEPQVVAVIDIGASSLRMQIAEIHNDNRIVRLESFEQAVSLGKDSFTKGKIDRSTIEDCVHVLTIYREKLNEYEITDPRKIRVIATSGVKEAANRLAFQDRIFIATGFEIEPFDEAELHRVTFLGVSPFIEKFPEIFDDLTMVCEVGGGTTEFLLLNKNQVVLAQTYRLGALRLRKTLEAFEAPSVQSGPLMEARIHQTLQQFRDNFGDYQPQNLLAMGGDMRFAAKEIPGAKVADGLIELTLDQLKDFTDEILEKSTDHLATRYHLSTPEADSLGPALLCNYLIARDLGVNRIHVAAVNLRDGLVMEMAQGRKWSPGLQKQIVQSVLQLGRKFHFDEAHATHVSDLSCSIFEQLKDLHGLDDRFQGILQLSALVHEFGKFIGQRSYHKHTLYLIRNSEFFGIGAHDVELVGLVARYHRRATPQPSHEGYSSLKRADRVAVAKLAAILRVAKALDASRTQRIRQVNCEVIGKQVIIALHQVADISLEQLEINRTCQIFEDIFGTKIVIRVVEERRV